MNGCHEGFKQALPTSGGLGLRARRWRIHGIAFFRVAAHKMAAIVSSLSLLPDMAWHSLPDRFARSPLLAASEFRYSRPPDVQ